MTKVNGIFDNLMIKMMKRPMRANVRGVEKKKTAIIKTASEMNFVLGSSRCTKESTGI